MKNLTVSFYFILILALTSLVFGEEVSWNTYEDKYIQRNLTKILFSVRFPSNWEALPSGFNSEYGGELKEISFLTHIETPFDDYREGVTLEIEELNEYSKARYAGFLKLVSGAEKLESGEATIAGQQGNYAIYQKFDKYRKKVIKHKAYAFISPDKKTFYILRYSADPKEYERFLPAAEKVIKSFTLSPSRKTDEQTVQMETYKSGKFNQTTYSFDYPKSWELREISPKYVAVVSPESIRVAIIVGIKDLKNMKNPPKNLDACIERYDKYFSNKMLNYKVQERKKVRVANHDSYMTIYSYTDSIDTNRYFKVKAYTLFVDTLIFDIVFNSTPEKYDKFLPIAEKIIESFKWNK